MVLALIVGGIAALVATITYAYNYSYQTYPAQSARVESEITKVTGLFGTTVDFVDDTLAVLRGTKALGRRIGGFTGNGPGRRRGGGHFNQGQRPGIPSFIQTSADVFN
jgi:hypothetical protein